jgi:hypothetical protein
MTHHPLRLVVDHPDQSTSDGIEFQSPRATGIHVHFHLAAAAPIATVPAVASAGNVEGRSGKGRWKPWLIAAAGVAIAVGAFDFGARSGEGHARSAVALANAHNLAASRSGQPAASVPGDLPPSVRQLLAQPPTVTQPVGPSPSPTGASPFGLHP